jgi:hypothetical protein
MWSVFHVGVTEVATSSGIRSGLKLSSTQGSSHVVSIVAVGRTQTKTVMVSSFAPATNQADLDCETADYVLLERGNATRATQPEECRGMLVRRGVERGGLGESALQGSNRKHA